MKPPEVVLHVDHFIPVSKGGTNDSSNLLTSCSQCNQGKKARISVSPDEESNLENIIVDKKEVLKQMRRIKKLDDAIHLEKDLQMCDITDYWGIIHGDWDGLTNRNVISLRTFLKYFSVSEIKEAMDLAYSQCTSNSYNAEFKYMCGILQNWRKGFTSNPNSYE